MFSSLRKIYRNTLFRLSLLGAFLFMLSLFVAMAYVYYATIAAELKRVDRSIESEITELQGIYDKAGQANILAARASGQLSLFETEGAARYKEIYDRGGADAVRRAVFLRGSSHEGLYILQTSRSVTGNLAEQAVKTIDSERSLLPGLDNAAFTKLEFLYSDPQNKESELNDRRSRGIAGNLLQNGEPVIGVVVGRDVETTMRTAERIRTAILTSAALALVLGLISSWFVSRRFARQVESFNRLATDVRAGNLERRAPRNYSEDEMDLLAEHLNAMLDHISRLMSAMRYAGDSVAHDLRTPLTRLRTRLETAAVERAGSEEAEILYAAANDADQLLTTFDSVLRIARLEAGEQRELLTPLDPKPILDDLAELYEPACEDAGLHFKTDIAARTTIMASRGLLSQAVSNLLENAIKYTPRGGHIWLKCRKTRGGVEISICDDGPGIPSWDRGRVKERFVRLDKSRSLPGSGLGLSLVDAVADLHGAEFSMSDNEDLQSSNPDRPGLRACLNFSKLKRPLEGKAKV